VGGSAGELMCFFSWVFGWAARSLGYLFVCGELDSCVNPSPRLLFRLRGHNMGLAGYGLPMVWCSLSYHFFFRCLCAVGAHRADVFLFVAAAPQIDMSTVVGSPPTGKSSFLSVSFVLCVVPLVPSLSSSSMHVYIFIGSRRLRAVTYGDTRALHLPLASFSAFACCPLSRLALSALHVPC
jgi:hypothetical protein